MNFSIHRTRLANGITLLVIENSAVDLVAARFFWRGGSSFETRQQAGLGYLVASLLTKGTDSRSAADIAEQVESVGAILGAESTPDYFSVSLKAVTRDFEDMFRLACETIRTATFPGGELERERSHLLQTIRAQQERPFSVAYEPMRTALFGKEHPYAVPVVGMTETVSALEQQDLLEYHRCHFRSQGLVVAIAGKISVEAAEALVQSTLGDWQDDAPNAHLDFPPLPQHREETLLSTEQDTQQSIAMLGFRGPSLHSKEWIPLKLATTHLGGGLSSRLFVELREKRGLAYEVSASYSPRLEMAPVVAYLGTAPTTLMEALTALRAEIERLLEQPLTAEELEIAKSKLTGLYALSKQTNAQLAQLLGWYEVLGVGIEYDQHYPELIASVTLEDIQAVAQRHLAYPVISLAGPAVSRIENPVFH